MYFTTKDGKACAYKDDQGVLELLNSTVPANEVGDFAEWLRNTFGSAHTFGAASGQDSPDVPAELPLSSDDRTS